MLTNQNSTAFWLIDNLWMPLATSHLTQDHFSLMEQVCGTGIGGPQTHMHPTDEGRYILEGHVTFQVGGQEIEAGPEQGNQAKRNKSHATSGMEIDKALAFWVQDGLFTVVITGKQTGGSYSLLHQRLSPGSGPTPHSHEQDEAIYVLKGELTLVAGHKRFTASAGSFIYIPKDTVRTFRVESAEARLLNWYLPGGFEQLVQEEGVPATVRENQ